MVLLLYGHPEAGAHWEAHLDGILQFPEFPSSYFFPDTRLLLTVYVDDFTLSGPTGCYDAFWKLLREKIELEPETGLDRILGRHHEEFDVNGKSCLALTCRTTPFRQ